MNEESETPALEFRSEARLILIHARKAWSMLPARFKWAFAGASARADKLSEKRAAAPGGYEAI